MSRRGSGKGALTIKVDMQAVNALVSGLKADMEDAVRPAAQAAAQVLYDEVKRNVSRIGRKKGNLASAIYQAFSQDNSGNGKATYHVSWNARKAPHAHLIEYGYIQKYQVVLTKSGKWITLKNRPLAQPRHVGAMPFIRPAMSAFSAAGDAAGKVIIDRLVKKY